MDYVTIDFEASCLPRHGRSFPIEVGVSGAMGTRSWLIKPDASWREWTWTQEAFGLHGIRREQLEEEGLAPEIVAAELWRAIGDRRVIADSGIDVYWLRTLAEAAAQPIPFKIEHIGTVFDELGATTDQILSAQRRVDQTHRARHRAGVDARWLSALITTVEQLILESHTPAVEPWHPHIAWRSAAPASPTSAAF